MKLFIFSMMCLLMASCGKFHGTDMSVWAEGLWIIPWGLGIGAAWSLYRAYRGSRSGSKYQDKSLPVGQQVQYRKENVPIYKVKAFVFFVGLLLAMIGAIILQNLEK